jgi:hypothetical protein
VQETTFGNIQLFIHFSAECFILSILKQAGKKSNRQGFIHWRTGKLTGSMRARQAAGESGVAGLLSLQRNLMHISLEYLRLIGYYGLKSQKGGSPYVAGDSPN